jgi:hypothetical protein
LDGCSEDSTWFHFQMPDEDKSAWIFGNLIEIEGDLDILPVLEADADSGPSFGPMQAFYFRSGITGGQCIGAPRDGILVQTPKGQGEILLRANEVNIQLGSTAYTEEEIANLPVGNLPDLVEVAAPLDESALIAASIAGDYAFVENFEGYFCGNDSGRVSNETGGIGRVFSVEFTDNGIRYTFHASGFNLELAQTGPASYSGSTVQTVQGAGSITTTVQIEFASASGGLWTTITAHALSYCGQTFTRQARFERVG